MDTIKNAICSGFDIAIKNGKLLQYKVVLWDESGEVVFCEESDNLDYLIIECSKLVAEHLVRQANGR
jgi:hypothetical protein